MSAFFNKKVSCVAKTVSLSLSFHGWSDTGTSGQKLEQISDLFQYPTTPNFSAPVSLRDKLLIPQESPEKGLSFGIGSFSLRDTGAEKLGVVGYWNRSEISRSIWVVGYWNKALPSSNTKSKKYNEMKRKEEKISRTSYRFARRLQVLRDRLSRRRDTELGRHHRAHDRLQPSRQRLHSDLHFQ